MFGIRALLRTIFYGTLLWFLLAILWFALPSPSAESRGDPAAYSTYALSRGETVTRVYDINDFFPDDYAEPRISREVPGDPVALAHRTSNWSFVLSYTLDRARRFLRINDDCLIDLRAPRERLPFLSKSYATASKTGDMDGINAPWFTRADATILYWWIHRDFATIKVRVLWSETGHVEIWPDTQRYPVEGGTDFTMSTLVEPLLTLSLNASRPFKATPPPAIPTWAPSRTLPLRQVIQMFIAPTGLLFYFLFRAIQPLNNVSHDLSIYLLKTFVIYYAALLLVWLCKGRPPFHQFLAKFPIVCYFVKKAPARRAGPAVWGVAGPIDDDDDEPLHRGDSRLIHSVGDFFRSSAPLDDLLATFETTRHLTEPMERQQSSLPPSLQVDGEGELYGRHRKAYPGHVQDELIDLEAAVLEKALLR